VSKSKKKNDILIYQTEDGKTKVETFFDDDNIWLPLDKIANLFQRDKSTISRHIKSIFQDGELDDLATVAKYATVQNEGSRQVSRDIEYYNLEMIIAIGYRVKSHRGIHFRKWATSILKEYMQKGFVMNDELLKNAGGGTYFKELLDRIRDIRSSEKVFYRQVLDLFATSIDYNPKSEVAIEFFKIMQNKLHFAVHQHTAAELIASRANSESPFMGLQAFKGLRPNKNEVLIAKNYLNENEIKQLNLMVSAYLEIAEMKAYDQEIMYMSDWVKELERFIVYREKPTLSAAGEVSHEEATKIASNEYDKYIKKSAEELTQAEMDFLDTVMKTYELLEGKPHKTKGKKKK